MPCDFTWPASVDSTHFKTSANSRFRKWHTCTHAGFSVGPGHIHHSIHDCWCGEKHGEFVQIGKSVRQVVKERLCRTHHPRKRGSCVRCGKPSMSLLLCPACRSEDMIKWGSMKNGI